MKIKQISSISRGRNRKSQVRSTEKRIASPDNKKHLICLICIIVGAGLAPALLPAQDGMPVFRFTLDNILAITALDESNPFNPDNFLEIDEISNTVRLTAETEGDLDKLAHYGLTGRLTLDSAGDTDSELREAWVSLGRDFGSMIKIGKQKAAWGKGYVWSPADYINRPKNALDTDDPVQGRTMVLGDIPFANGSFSAVFIPDPDDDTHSGTELKDSFSALRLSRLIHDTDLAVVAGLGPDNEKKYGFSLSQPAGSVILTFEVSWSTYPDKKYYTYTSDPLNNTYFFTEDDDYKVSGVLGFNYRTAGGDGFLTGEIYYNESGWDGKEMESYLRLSELASGNTAVYGWLYEELIGQYVPARMGQRYAYLSYTHTVHDFYTMGCSAIHSFDSSFTYITPSFVYTGINDADIRAEILIPAGNTDDGEGSLFMTHPVVSLWLTVYF